MTSDDGTPQEPPGARTPRRRGRETPEDPRLARFLAYWREKCGDRDMPQRDDVDPLELGAALLPVAYMVDVLDEARDFRYRVVGTDIVANTQSDFTGRRLSEIADIGTQGTLAEIYAEVCAHRRPLVELVTYLTASGNTRYYEVVVAPLGAGRVEMLMGCAVHHWRADPAAD